MDNCLTGHANNGVSILKWKKKKITPSQESERSCTRASFYDFSIGFGFWKCSDSVVLLVFHFLPLRFALRKMSW